MFISVPMPNDVDVNSIELVSAPKSIGLRVSRIGCDEQLCRAFGALESHWGPAVWQLNGGALLIKIRFLPDEAAAVSGSMSLIGQTSKAVEGIFEPGKRKHQQALNSGFRPEVRVH